METKAHRRDNSWFCLLAACLTAMFFKAALQAANAFPFNSDEAIVALMARHFLQGERPVFFYGQSYMGSLDAVLVSIGFWALGEQTWVVRAVQAALYLGTLLTTAALGRVVFNDSRVGLAAAWLLAIPTVNLTLYSTVSLGGYGEMLVIGNLILLCALALGRNPWKTGLRQDFTILAAGFLSGLGLWAFGLTLVYSLPAVLYVGWRAWQTRPQPPGLAAWGLAARRTGLLIMGFLAGSAPWWLYARAAGFEALISELSGSAIAGVEGLPWTAQVLRHSLNLVLFGGTVIAGLRPPWGIQWLAGPILPLALAVWMGTLAYAAARLLPSRSRAGITHPVGSTATSLAPELAFPAIERKIRHGRLPSGAFLLAGVGFTLVSGFILSPFGADPSGRYFLPLAVIFALFIAWAVVDWRERRGQWVYGLIALLLLFNLWGTMQLVRTNPPGLSTQIDITTQIDHRYDAALINFLQANGETHGYTTYWAAYPLAFLSGEQLIFQPRLPYHHDFRYTSRDDRYSPYAEQVAAARKVAYITVRHPGLEARLRSGFSRLGIAYQEAQIGDYCVFYRLSRVVRPEDLGL